MKKNYKMRFVICIHRQILSDQSIQEGYGGQDLHKQLYRASILFGHDPAFSQLPVRLSASTFPLLRVQTNC
jgi:hypothetical protein